MTELIKVPVNATVIASLDYDGKVTYRLYPAGYSFMCNDGEIAVDTNYPIVLELPKLSPDTMREKAIETLKAKQAKIYADAEKEHAEIQEKINELLCLTYEG